MEIATEEIRYTKVEGYGMNGERVIVTAQADDTIRITVPRQIEMTLDDLDALAATCRCQFG